MFRQNQMIRRVMRDTRPGWNGPEKQFSREALIKAMTGTPTDGFTLCGMDALCLKEFRARWPTTAFVCVDKQATGARFTEAHELSRKIGDRILPNKVFSTTLASYSKRHFPLCQITKGNKIFLGEHDYDFPKFDFMFLDTTNRWDNEFEREAIVRMINEHTAPYAIVGVTMSLGAKGKRESSAFDLASQMLLDIERSCNLTYVQDYTTQSSMAFWIYAVE